MYKTAPEIERIDKDATNRFIEVLNDWINSDECPNLLDVEEYVGRKLPTLRKYARIHGYHIHVDGNWIYILTNLIRIRPDYSYKNVQNMVQN